MNEQSAVEGASTAALLAKILASPGAIGVLAAVVGFLFAWPKSAKEGGCRIAASMLSSHFFGAAMLKTVLHFVPWLVAEDVSAACYGIVALPAWWIGAWIFRWLENRRNKDAGDIAAELAEGTKKVKELL